MSFSYSFRPDEVYSSRWKLVFNESTVLFQRKSTTSNVTTEWEIYTNKGSIGKISHPQGKNSTPCRRHHSTTRVLSQKHILFFPRPVLWTGQGCGYGSPVSPIVASLYVEYFEQKALSTAPYPQVLEQVCGWHICHPRGNPQTGFPTTHQQCWPCHSVYSGEQ